MKSFNLGSISRNLGFLVLLAVLPALGLVLYTGMEQRRTSIEAAKQDVLLLTHTMAEAQKNITRSSRQILSTLALLPEIQNLAVQASSEIFAAVLEKNPEHHNLVLTDLDGKVLAAGRAFSGVSLADRKHVREALESKDFAVGEYILTRVGASVPVLPFAYPVLDKNGRTKGVLTTVVKLTRFSSFYDGSSLPVKSFVAITDHQGTRLFYYPPKENTNPVGQSIKAGTWELASNAQEPRIFTREGSDGVRRIFAFEQVRLTPEATPYVYVWAGIPENSILAPADAVLIRNVLIMILATLLALFVSWLLGKSTLISPITDLVAMTRKIAAGDLEFLSAQADKPDEIGTLTRAFHDMAEALLVGQTALRENEARFRLIMDSLDALVYVADLNTYEVLFINAFGRKEHGDIVGKICWQSVQNNQSGPCSFCSNQHLLDADGQPGEIYIWEHQNEVTGHWYYIHDRAIKWIDGRIVRLEIATDITERKLTETKLADETERLAVTLRSIGDGVITTDTQGRVILINPVAETLTGWDSDEAAGRPINEVFNVVNGATRQPCDSPLGKVFTADEIIALADYRVLIAKNGPERSISYRGAPIRDKAGEVIGVVLVFRDITAQLRTDQELIKVKKLESIGVLAGGIAHDFNNILAAILGNIDLSLRDANLSERTQRLLTQALNASYRARDLTQQLLTFAKGGQPIKETASLAEVVKDSADFILRGDQVACRYHCCDDLWLVDIDKGQISQVVQNIILNASHAMPAGGIIEVSCENVSSKNSMGIPLAKTVNCVKLTIKDTGIGIPANALDKIFDPYFSTKQQGSGLGLAIAHSIVSKHGGSISVQSTPGIGTIFSVYLPASLHQSIPLAESGNADFGRRKARIMVMDDEELVRTLAEEMLSEIGHEILLATDGMEAVQIYQQAMESGSPIDLIIMDLTIPGGMGGKEAVRKILAIDADAKVIVSSGYSNDPAMANFAGYGFCAALVKPYQFNDITWLIGQVLN